MRIVLLAFTATLVACGSRPDRLYYETTAVLQDPLTEGHRGPLVERAKKRLGDRKLSLQDKSGATKKLSKSDLKKQSLAVLHAISTFAAEQFIGGEADVLARVKGKKGAFPVSVRVSKKGAMVVQPGARFSFAKAADAKTLKSRYRTGPLKETNERWNEPSRSALEHALQLLSPEERELLVRLPFIRMRGKGKGARGAEHIQHGCKEKIQVYTRAFKGRLAQFAGEPHAPHPATTLTVLHELGHALHARPGRLKFCEYERRFKPLKGQVNALNAKVKRYNSLARKGKNKQARALGKELERDRARLEKEQKTVEGLAETSKDWVEKGPVLKAYEKVLGKKAAPTVYGESSLKESFAESFALYKADPKALGRLLPKVLGWFQSDGHLKALGAARRRSKS